MLINMSNKLFATRITEVCLVRGAHGMCTSMKDEDNSITNRWRRTLHSTSHTRRAQNDDDDS